MEKPIRPSRPTRPSPERAPSVPDRRAPPVGANLRTSSLPLSLSLFCGANLSAPFLSHARPLSLCPADPTRQPVPNLPPTSLAVDAPTSAHSWATSTRPRPFRPCAPLAHLPPAHLRPQPSSLAPLSLCARDQTSTDAAHRRPPPFHDRR
jgi:hypothetical protein